jgi:serine/threonine-protein kinase HipA
MSIGGGPSRAAARDRSAADNHSRVYPIRHNCIHLSQDAGATRESAAEGQFSLSGAQAKSALYFDRQRKRWGIPQGRTPTTHILKPVSNDFNGIAENEHFCLELARRIGLAAANTEWHSIGGIPTLIAQRYDRVQLAGRWHRVHQEDCCQALGIHPGSKYENEGGPGVSRLLARSDGRTLEEFLTALQSRGGQT